MGNEHHVIALLGFHLDRYRLECWNGSRNRDFIVVYAFGVFVAKHRGDPDLLVLDCYGLVFNIIVLKNLYIRTDEHALLVNQRLKQSVGDAEQ